MKLTTSGKNFTILKQDIALNSIFVIQCRCLQKLPPKRYLTEVEFLDIPNRIKSILNWVLHNPYHSTKLNSIGMSDFGEIVMLFFEIENKELQKIIQLSIELDSDGYVVEKQIHNEYVDMSNEDLLFIKDIIFEIMNKFTKKSALV